VLLTLSLDELDQIVPRKKNVFRRAATV